MRRIFILIIPAIFVAAGAYAQGIDNENLLVTHGPWIQNLTSSGVTIVWTTNKPAIPGITLTLPDGKTKFIRNSHFGNIDGGGLLHKVAIENLEPGTTYKYALNSVQVLKYQAYRVYYGDTLTGKNMIFATPPDKSDKVTFTVFNDVHELSGKLGSYLRNNDRKAQDLYFFNGDMINYLQEHDQIFRGFLDTSVFYFASVKPFYYVRGNHESRGYLARDLRDYFVYPEERYYYSFDRGPVHFTVLDCGEDKPDNSREYYGLADFDAYRAEELKWLEKEVSSDAFRKAHYRIVIIHMPVVKAEKQNHAMTWLSENFGPILKDAGADMVFSAHTHRNAFYDRDKSGFGYALLVNSNNSFVEVTVDKTSIKALVKDIEGKVLSQYEVKK
ncbi:MAG TPA: FN3 domain-containing metallophosphoesterase family protein [Bacteroidales bacterium]|nr:FN3 domain-containing metallophosphoesterase family protein [Bacteroidales bacterium]